ncbi:MAG: META domain-containing protein [Acidimicrobiia bacterium]|nr:META domain-containing protein [Acidimicrobiia bacterium]
MNGSGRKTTLWLLPLLLFVTSCDDPVTVVVEAEPEEVETCEWLIPIGIELVNDYFYTIEESDVAASLGDPAQLPTSIIALNARGADLDRRADELECNLAELNTAIVAATEGLEPSDPITSVFLDTVRGGVLAPEVPAGEWVFVEGMVLGEPIVPAPGQRITLVVNDDGTASGSAGCNQYSLFGSVADGEWQIERLETSQSLCPSDVHATAEDRYFTGLMYAWEYTVSANSLLLGNADTEFRFEKTVAED